MPEPDATTYCFLRKYRLSGPTFSKVFEQAQAIRKPRLMLLMRPNSGSSARLGFVVGKKAVKRAVQRNWIKRLLRDRFRLARENLPAIDMVFIVRRGHNANAFDKSDFKRQLEGIWKKLLSTGH